jgi:hypothetical protein
MGASADAFEEEMPDFGWTLMGLSGYDKIQDCYDDETHPDGFPYDPSSTEFDAALEEVLHIITQAWAALYPSAFGLNVGSEIADAMDIARGGYYA